MKIDSKYHYSTGTHCWYCKREYSTTRCLYNRPGAPLEKTVDHIIPRSGGGNNTSRNKISCCNDCNALKGNKTLLQFIDYLDILLLKGSGYCNMYPLLKIITNSTWKLNNKIKIESCLK